MGTTVLRKQQADPRIAEPPYPNALLQAFGLGALGNLATAEDGATFLDGPGSEEAKGLLWNVIEDSFCVL